MWDMWCTNGCEVGFSLNTSVFTWLYLSTSSQYSFQILPTIHCTWISLILTQGPSLLQPQLNLDTYHLTLHNSLLSSSFVLYFCSFCCCNLTGYFHISPHLEIKNKCVSTGTRQSLVSLHSHQDIHDEGKKTVLPLHGMRAFGIVEVEFHLILIFALDGSEWSVSSPICCNPEESLWLPANRRQGYTYLQVSNMSL